MPSKNILPDTYEFREYSEDLIDRVSNLQEKGYKITSIKQVKQGLFKIKMQLRKD